MSPCSTQPSHSPAAPPPFAINGGGDTDPNAPPKSIYPERTFEAGDAPIRLTYTQFGSSPTVSIGELLPGSDDAEEIIGGLDVDALFGADGDDLLKGGAGADLLHGEKGDDRLVGQGGADTLEGKLGHDTLLAGPGDDRLFAGIDSTRFRAHLYLRIRAIQMIDIGI